MEAGHIHPAPPHEEMCLAERFAMPSHSKLENKKSKKKVVDSKRFPKEHFLYSLPLHSKYLLGSSCSSSLRSVSEERSELGEQWSLHLSLIQESYHRFRPGLENHGWWIIFSITGEITSGSERSLMVGSNRAFHGKRPYRLWASSYPRISPGTAIHWEPEEQNCSVTPSKSLACWFHLSKSMSVEVWIYRGRTKSAISPYLNLWVFSFFLAYFLLPLFF